MPCRSVSVLFLFLLGAAAFAQGGPPLITDDTETVPKGKWEVNLAWSAELSAGRWQHEAPTFDFNRGISDRAHVNFEAPWVFASESGVRTDGIGNAGVGSKWLLIPMRGRGAAVSIHPALEFNVSRRSARLGLVDTGTSAVFPIEAQWDCGGTGVNLDFGGVFGPGSPPGWTAGIAVGREAAGSELLAEVHGDGVFATGENVWVAQVGLRHDFSEASTLLLAFGRSVAANGPPVRWTSYLALQLHF